MGSTLLCDAVRATGGHGGKLLARRLLIRVTDLCVEIFVVDHLALKDMSFKNVESKRPFKMG